jgi:hypothetical protein
MPARLDRLNREPQEKLARKLANGEPGNASQGPEYRCDLTGEMKSPAFSPGCLWASIASKIEAVAMHWRTNLPKLKNVPCSEK